MPDRTTVFTTELVCVWTWDVYMSSCAVYVIKASHVYSHPWPLLLLRIVGMTDTIVSCERITSKVAVNNIRSARITCHNAPVQMCLSRYSHMTESTTHSTCFLVFDNSRQTCLWEYLRVVELFVMHNTVCPLNHVCVWSGSAMHVSHCFDQLFSPLFCQQTLGFKTLLLQTL